MRTHSKKQKSLYEEVASQARSAHAHSEEEVPIEHVIRMLREKKRLTGAAVCRNAGDLDPRTLNALEKGRVQNPSMKTLQSVARGLGISITDLFRFKELCRENSIVEGTQKGSFTMEFPKRGLKMVSFTPLIPDFFCGKLILSAGTRVDETFMANPVPLFVSVLIGKLEVTIESEVRILREGDNIFFNGFLKHRFYNPLHKEISFLLVMAPSFLKSDR